MALITYGVYSLHSNPLFHALARAKEHIEFIRFAARLLQYAPLHHVFGEMPLCLAIRGDEPYHYH